MRNPYTRRARGTAVGTTSHNIHKRWVRGRVPRSAGAPTASESASRGHNNSIPKPWQVRVHRSLHVNTPYAVTLQPLGLVGRQHGVVAVSVIVREDGVVAPQHRIHSTPTEDDEIDWDNLCDDCGRDDGTHDLEVEH